MSKVDKIPRWVIRLDNGEIKDLQYDDVSKTFDGFPKRQIMGVD